MSLDEDTLENVARDGEMDYAKWPDIVEPLLERLNHIVSTDFPIPRPYTNVNRPPDPPSPTQDRTEATETDLPTSNATITTQAPATPVRQLPPVPLFPNSSATSHIPESLPPSQSPPSSQQHSLESLPTPLLQLLESITTTIRAAFLSKPPHTIQRLAELILNPQKHYKTLPAWLRAVDRVVNVSSSADIFPLDAPQHLVNGVNGDTGGILWKNDAMGNGYDRDSLGSDESLGGALLTPIPWLRNVNSETSGSEDLKDTEEEDGLGESLDMPVATSFPVTRDSGSASGNGGAAMAVAGHGDPLVPERIDGAVTQGELIRMEQEAGVIPVAVNRTTPGTQEEGDEDDHIHARGPDVVGAIDMGKVDGKDVQVRIGSPPTEDGSRQVETNPNDAQEVLKGSGREVGMSDETSVGEDFEIVKKEDDMMVDEKEGEDGKDEDIVLVDADGKMEDEDERNVPK